MRNHSIKYHVLLLLLACTSTLVTYGQPFDYNKTYPYNIDNLYSERESVDIISDGDGNTIVLSYDDVRRPNEFMLTKLDFQGNILWEENHAFNATLMEPYKLIETQNGDIIVVGLHQDNDYSWINPFAAKFDAWGTLLSGRIYISNTGGFASSWANSIAINSRGFLRVNIVKTEGTGSEDYIIVCPGVPPFSPTNPRSYPPLDFQDVCVNALRIDVNLNMSWNYKYFYPTPAARQAATSQDPAYSGFWIFSQVDHPHAVTHVNTGGSDKYVIGGTSWQTLNDPVGGATFHHYFNLFMSIDNLGSIVDPYQGEYTYSYPFGMNMLWDQATNEIVASYTVGNTALATTGTPPTSVPASVIGISKLDPSNLNIVGGTSDFYYFQNSTENYAYGIIENEAQDGYVIPVWQHDQTTYAPQQIETKTSAIFEIDKNTAAINFAKQFNPFREVYTAGIAYNHSPMHGATNYVIAANAMTNPNTKLGDIRVTSTDIGGNTCCSGTWQSGLGTINHSSSESPYSFITHQENGDQAFSSNFTTEVATVDDCYNSSNCNYWKPTAIEEVITDNTIKVYPTLIEGNTQLTVDINSTTSQALSMSIYSIEGKKITEKNVDVNTGDNSVKWDVSLPSSGNYIMQIQSKDNSLNKTIKLTNL